MFIILSHNYPHVSLPEYDLWQRHKRLNDDQQNTTRKLKIEQHERSIEQHEWSIEQHEWSIEQHEWSIEQHEWSIEQHERSIGS